MRFVDRQLDPPYRRPTPLRIVGRLAWLALAGWLLGHFLGWPGSGRSGQPAAGLLAQEKQEKAAEAKEPVVAFRFDVTLPISGKAVQSRVDQVLSTKVPKGGPRPVFVFEFRAPVAANDSGGSEAAKSAGEGTDFGSALELARFLTSEQLSQVRTVAWVPHTVKGHAVLPILACEQIVIGKQAEIGAAGIKEKTIDQAMRTDYAHIAEQRRTIPTAVALGLLDPRVGVFKVTTPDGVRYETAEELTKLREQGKVTKEETIFQPGDQHLLSGNELRFRFGFASHLADDRQSLAAALQLPLSALLQDLAPEGGWKPVLVPLHGPIHHRSVNIVEQTINMHGRDNFNLLILSIDSGGGDLSDSVRLAKKLSSLGQNVHTVAFVENKALSDAAVVALACDELVMLPGARIGGRGEASQKWGRRDPNAARLSIQDCFSDRGRDWSLAAALYDPDVVEVFRYTHRQSGEQRILSEEEAGKLTDPDQWQRDARPLDTNQGLSADELERLGLARKAQNFEQMKAMFQLSELRRVGPNWALAAVEFLSRSEIAAILLFVGWFALMFELSTPGVGLPGFIAIVCFILYFWSQILHGTANALEILLFVGGLICLAVEVFVLPGTAVFGVGGGIMVVVSIVLASQTFVVPTNAYQMRQFPASLLMVAAGMAGGVASIYVIRRFLPDTPYFNRMLLAPPRAEEREAISRRESMVALDHLAGKRGITTTPLVPAGKVQFGDELIDCVSNGELVAKGTPVVVEEVAGNRIVVRKA